MALLLIASLDGAERFEYRLSQPETMIGRNEENDIVLADMSVSGSHAAIRLDNGKYLIEDLGSSNGTIVNKVPVEKKFLKHGDQILLGNYAVVFDEEPEASSHHVPASARTVEKKDASGCSIPAFEPFKPVMESVAQPVPSLADEDPADSDIYLDFRCKAHNLLIERMDLKRLPIESLARGELRQRAEVVANKILQEMEDEIPRAIPHSTVLRDILNETLGLGPLEDLLNDPTITEIMVNNKDQIYVERRGKIYPTKKRFLSDTHVRSVIDRIVAPIGRRIDESSPIVDARLNDGSRVNVVIPPLAIKGPSITIRKFSERPYTVEDLIRFGTFTRGIAKFLGLCIMTRQNIVVSGGTGTGKTTLLNVLASYIPRDERIVTIEDAAELSLPQEHVVSLEARPQNIEGKGAITIRDLVRNALRMRPDRIVVGECRGGEALDMLQAMNTGHDGSITTGHANSPRDMIARLETMVMMAGMELPLKAIREQIASAVDVIVQLSRFVDGTRKVTRVVEVAGMEGDIITLQDVFTYHQESVSGDGRVIGKFIASGFIPKFVEQLKGKGIEVPISMFQDIG